ncbi:Uncharacterized protein MA16_Dca027787 [Dendrobium catenatum]|uniref:Uncharacterized protein n=1 Tax=Dendrobium catenatum TaxID=906689 RepID=A0A2I0WYK5_9ASPA|nr:Uncharacterized protein MA16_Dca027787 [Dendrobium catenatum]
MASVQAAASSSLFLTMASISNNVAAARRARYSYTQTHRSKPLTQIGARPVGLRFLVLPANCRVRISLISCKPRVSPFMIRASVQLPYGIRPGGRVETDKLPSDVRKRAMDAVDSYGGRVTIGDVASRAGLKLNEAEIALQALAADTNGFLEVCLNLHALQFTFSVSS